VAPGQIHRYTYADFGRRSQQLMHALDRLGLEWGDRVATLAWNSYRHLECYFAIPCTGRVLHTLNLRLSPEDLSYVIRNADDRAILVDPDLVPLLEKVQNALSGVKHIVVMDETVPSSSLPNLISYEDLIADEGCFYPRTEIPENTPLGMCYTSGTTGRPKGVIYTHRSTFLHSLGASSAAGLGIGPADCVMPVVPMFHANAWGMPHAAAAVGAKQVFSGAHLDAKNLVDLLAGERVTITAGVTTVWLNVAEELARRDIRLPHLRFIAHGGGRPPQPMIERYLQDFGLSIVQAWGMTETSPIGSIAWPKEKMKDWDSERITEVVRTQAGIPLPGVDVTIRDEEGNSVPWDGKAMGDLLVRGPWIVDSYYGGESTDQFTPDGWFRTGDVAIGSPEGYFVIVDRTKDLIKSGGEWISSVDMEGAIMAMADVLEAVVIAIPHPKWQERPLACVVPRNGATVTLEQVRAHLEGAGFARWQLPDRVESMETLPRTGVGKFDKKALRARFAPE
ncbi:MAG: long-chain fatty acid--CoA ligase, partial [Actinomycetota bacterium]